MNGIGKRPSDLRKSSGITAKSKAITRLTAMMNKLSVVKKSPEPRALMTAIAKKASATRMHKKFSSVSSLLIS